MPELVFSRQHVLEAIRRVDENGIQWLYRTYPKPGGQARKASTGFLIYEGSTYPVKALGRLANEIAGNRMHTNPITDFFRARFSTLGFDLIQSAQEEATAADERQRRLAEVWARPNQAAFRLQTFEVFGRQCLVTGCKIPEALEAAHVIAVADQGGDQSWNGVPLRADLHRLFDAGLMSIEPDSWTVMVKESATLEYGQYQGRSITANIQDLPQRVLLATALRERNKSAGYN